MGNYAMAMVLVGTLLGGPHFASKDLWAPSLGDVEICEGRSGRLAQIESEEISSPDRVEEGDPEQSQPATSEITQDEPAPNPDVQHGLTQSELFPTESGQTLELTEVINRVQAFYDGIESYHADFEQTYTNVALAESEVSTGHVYFLKPGRMRWDYSEPQQKYLISDGEVVWIYEPEFNQVARVELASTDLPSALRFLMGEGVLAEDFEITSCTRPGEGTRCLHLVSRTGEGDYQYLEFIVDDMDFRILQTLVVDPIGNHNRFVFRNASTTDPLPEEGFRFTPPHDARIVTPE